jgi:lipoprotein NlpD
VNIEAIITLFLIVVGLVWGFWLIFKRDLMQNQIGKLLSYFLGVVVTLLLVMWLASQFLPWWAVRLVKNTQDSPNVQELTNVSTDLWNDLGNPTINLTPQPPNTSPNPTISPITAPQGSTSQAATFSGSRTHVVQQGDTLYRLSRLYNTTEDEIRKANNIEGNLIKIGQTLVIP